MDAMSAKGDRSPEPIVFVSDLFQSNIIRRRLALGPGQRVGLQVLLQFQQAVLVAVRC
jgi:hypothetical protein